jgi:hypothetical protein
MTESLSGRRAWSASVAAKCAPIGLIVLVYSSSLAVLASALHRQYGFPLDDSYIHQTVARNFARYGVLGFIPGVPSSGATSSLWACIQAFNHRFTHVDPVVFNLVLSWVILAIIGMLLFLLAGRDGLPMPQRIAFAIAPACSGNFIWLALIGMEHLLFVAIVLGCVYFWFDQRNTRCALLAGICAGVLCLVRPEAMIFGPVLAVVAWKDKRPIQDILAVLAPWIVGVAILLSVDLYTSHSLMPTTLQGKSWAYLHAFGGPHSLQSIHNFVLGWISRFRLQFSVWHPDSRFVILRVLISLTLAITGAIWLIANVAPRIRFLFIFAAAHSCVYLAEFPVAGQGGRYQPLNLLLLFPSMFFGLLYLIQRITRNPQIVTAISLATLITAGTASLRTWRIVTIVSVAHINDTHGLAARWLLHNIPPNANVAAYDIGRISYDLNRGIIDLGGLVDSSFLPYLQSHQVRRYLREQHAVYLVAPSGGFEPELGFPRSSQPQLAKLAEFCSPQESWYVGWIYIGHAEQCQIIYKIPSDP